VINTDDEDVIAIIVSIPFAAASHT